jgi:hypothetical protein
MPRLDSGEVHSEPGVPEVEALRRDRGSLGPLDQRIEALELVDQVHELGALGLGVGRRPRSSACRHNYEREYGDSEVQNEQRLLSAHWRLPPRRGAPFLEPLQERASEKETETR